MTAVILPLISMIVGAVLQFIFTRHLDNKKHQHNLRAKAYADYLRCVSENANSRYNKNTTEGMQLDAKTVYAKSRISLYGAPAVISAFAEFERLGATINTSEQSDAFIEMVVAMRQDSLSNSLVASADLKAVLIGVHNTT